MSARKFLTFECDGPGIHKKISRAIWNADGAPKGEAFHGELTIEDYRDWTRLVLRELQLQGYRLYRPTITTSIEK